MSQRSFKYFFETVLGFDYADHHAQWDEGLEENRYYRVKASRDHGKSVFFMSYALWIAFCCSDPTHTSWCSVTRWNRHWSTCASFVTTSTEHLVCTILSPVVYRGERPTLSSPTVVVSWQSRLVEELVVSTRCCRM